MRKKHKKKFKSAKNVAKRTSRIAQTFAEMRAAWASASSTRIMHIIAEREDMTYPGIYYTLVRAGAITPKKQTKRTVNAAGEEATA